MRPRRHNTCCNGHDLTAPNALYVRHDGYTDCRACKREAVRRLRTSRAVAALRRVRAVALLQAPHLVSEITAQIAAIEAGVSDRRDQDLEHELDALVAAECLPRHLREPST